MTKSLRLYDGMKSVDLWNGDKGWDILSGPPSGSNKVMTAQDYFIRVPWLYRAVKDRATTVKKVAFAIVNDAGKDVDVSATWQDELGLFPYPRRMLHQIEESLVMTGRAYLFLETNNYGYVKKIKYCLPTSIKEKYDDNGDLDYYERIIKNRPVHVDPLNIVAIYDPDYTVEQGPGESSAAKAAMMASGVLFNTDTFIAAYFGRGAIKATILSVDTSDQREANRLQAWWEDVVAGIKNAWTALVIRAKTAVPTIIGQGLEGLENDSLTKSKRQDISTAIGVPESRLWAASANFATAEVENKAYFDDVIVPECWNIEEALNAQLFTAKHHMDDYRWEFRPETSAGFGKDQQAQATAYGVYVKDTGMLPSVAAQIVGLELPGEMEYEDLDPADTEEPPEVVTGIPVTDLTQQPALPAPATPGTAGTAAALPLPVKTFDSEAMRTALYNWKAASLTAVKTGHGANIDFDHPAIPEAIAEFLRFELDACKCADDVHGIFKKAREMAKQETQDPLLVLANEIKLAREAFVSG
jgi:hypothetical protein